MIDTAPTTQHIDLDIQGMTCASCAARIEKKLNKLDGVHASVNYATEKAAVTADRPISVDELLSAVHQAGYGATVPQPEADADADRDVETERLRRLLVVAVALTVPVIVLSMFPPLQFLGWQWLVFALTTPVVLWGGWRFHRAAAVTARHGAATMDTLISVGSLAAYLWSAYAMIFGHAGMLGMRHEIQWVLSRSNASENIYFEAAAAIITFQLVGRYLESRAKRQAGAAVRELLRAGAKEATVLRTEADGSVTEVRRPVSALSVKDRFVVRPGERIATDGVVEEGSAAVDQAVMTGESVPVQVGPGDDVIGATVNTDGRLVVRATRVGADTQLAQVAKLVEQAQTGKAHIQRLADRISAVFVPVVLAITVVTFVVWMLLGASAATALSAAVAVVIIACPCALGLATPTALLVGTGRGAELGIVIKGPEALERSGGIDTVLLDKTGTVTTGIMAVQSQASYGAPAGLVLAAAAAVESGSEHPVAKGIVTAATRKRGPVSRQATLPAATDFHAIAGGGAQAVVDHELIRVGSPALIESDAAAPAGYRGDLDALRARGETPVVVAWGGQIRGLFGVADEIKPDARAAVERLRHLGLRPMLLTGDHAAAAAPIAAMAGIDEVIADVRPADKAAVVTRLESEGRRVAMIGDGVNDAAALAQADLGIAMGTGTDAAIAAADLTLVSGDVALAPTAVALARATLRTIKGNLTWAFAYNVIAIPVAALGFLTPMLAGAAMACSSLFVVGNSLRLRRFGTKNRARPAVSK